SRVDWQAAVSDQATGSTRSIPLDFSPVIAPYKRHGRLSLRIEGMAPLSRFSAGRNNGNGSWSLATDELEDLVYILPEGMDKPHNLGIRIIRLDGTNATAFALLDFPVPLSAGTDQESGGTDATGDESDLREVAQTLRSLRDELAAAKVSYAARE